MTPPDSTGLLGEDGFNFLRAQSKGAGQRINPLDFIMHRRSQGIHGVEIWDQDSFVGAWWSTSAQKSAPVYEMDGFSEILRVKENTRTLF